MGLAGLLGGHLKLLCAADARKEHLAKLEGRYGAIVERCQIAVLSRLKDPASAILEKPTLEFGGDLMEVHFWFNAKNSFGGYTGRELASCMMGIDQTMKYVRIGGQTY